MAIRKIFVYIYKKKSYITLKFGVCANQLNILAENYTYHHFLRLQKTDNAHNVKSIYENNISTHY